MRGGDLAQNAKLQLDLITKNPDLVNPYLFRGLGMDYDNSMELCKSCVIIAEKK